MNVRDEDAMLRALRPHLRGVVEAADPELLDAFDAAYDDATVDAVELILHGLPVTDELSGEQASGLRGHAAATVLAFVINVAASIAVARFHSDHPAAWAWLAGNETPAGAAAGRSEPVVRLLARTELPVADRNRIVERFRADATLERLLSESGPP